MSLEYTFQSQVRCYLFLPCNLFLRPFYLSLQLLPIIPSTNSDMEGWRTRNGPGTSRDSSNGDGDNMMRVLHGMMESQHQQTELLRQALLTALRKQRPGCVSDFRRLQPATFSGTENPLNAEQWLIDTQIFWRQPGFLMRTRWKWSRSNWRMWPEPGGWQKKQDWRGLLLESTPRGGVNRCIANLMN